MTGSSTFAEDVVQEVFVALMRELDRYDSNRGPLRTYLFGIARNVSRYKTRSAWRLLPLDHARDAIVQDDDPVTVMSTNQQSQRLRRCLARLPPRYREVIILFDLQDLDYAEVAAVLRVPIGTVRSRLHRGRKLLIERLRLASRSPVATQCLI